MVTYEVPNAGWFGDFDHEKKILVSFKIQSPSTKSGASK